MSSLDGDARRADLECLAIDAGGAHASIAPRACFRTPSIRAAASRRPPWTPRQGWRAGTFSNRTSNTAKMHGELLRTGVR